jgi:2-oxoisovalerate dehydrogenase E1 component
MITVSTPVQFDRRQLTDEQLLALYRALLKPRMIEEKMLVLLRQGRISKWFSGYGQEATSVGAALALMNNEFILPMHRNLGVFTSRGIQLNQLFAQFQGKITGFTKGRDRSFHFGSAAHKIVGMISHLGPQLGIADGIALAHKLKKESRCTLVFTGDGGASEGDFHEALNTAAVWDLPVIFAVENNQWGLSTPSSEQFRCKQFIDKGIGYGIEAMQVDGNNILDVFTTVSRLADDIRQHPRPILLECVTFRMRGHEEASGTKYYPEGLQDAWSIKDPVSTYENWLLETGVLSIEKRDALRATVKQEIEEGLEKAFVEPRPTADTTTEVRDLFRAHPSQAIAPTSPQTTEKRFIDAISDGLRLAMRRHPNLVLMGQDIAEYGGVFKITEGFVQEFGKARVRNTPLCESAIVGVALGLSINGMKAMMEMQFADFVTEGFNQIVNNLAKIHWRWGQNADVVIRMPTGAGVAAGPYHSQSTEAWFFHTPGLKIVYPSNPHDAKGLLLAAFEDPNPILFFEHKALYRSKTGSVPDDFYTLEIGKASVLKAGTDLSIITYGYGVHWVEEVLSRHPEISADLIDLRTLLPLDKETIFASVRKTGRALVLHEDCLTGGIGGELAALLAQECFEYLDAPIVRVASIDTPVPFAEELEQNFLPLQRLEAELLRLHAY